MRGMEREREGGFVVQKQMEGERKEKDERLPLPMTQSWRDVVGKSGE